VVATPGRGRHDGDAAQVEADAAPAGVRPGALSALIRDIVSGGDEPASAWERALRPGAVIGRFELVRELGRGGFGIVYEARDRELGRAVAFKAITHGPGPDPGEERLLREADAAARLSHPNIVTLFDVGRTEHGPYLVFELLHGSTLAQRLEHGPLSAREALRIAVEVARGLAHAHANGVVHRDLTPGNVFLRDDGQVKLLDLGMAHAFGRRKVDGGTPSYMAPEQWRGAPEDERTDVFALGVVLYRMLSGELPFRDAAAATSSRAPRALEVPEAPALGVLVERMLAKDPVDRPRDAGEVLAALSAIEGEVSRAASAGEPLAVLRRERRSAWRTAALVAAGVLLGVAVAAIARHARAPAADTGAPSIAVLPFADLSPTKDQEYFSDGLSEEILNALAHIDGLHVTGRTSSFAFKGPDLDLRAVGQKLHVRAVLEGSVRKAGARVRITAQLIDVRSGYHLWSETFERELGDIFAVQDDIARAVVAALKVKLMSGRAPTTREHRTANPEVYAQYLLGRHQYGRFSPDGFRRAVEAFDKALAIDPAYAPAWAALSIPLYYLSEMEPSVDRALPLRQRALAAAERSVALDPQLAEGWSALSFLRGSVNWDWAQAQADMDRALALDPGDATIQRRYGLLLETLGHPEEALAATRRATELDPLFAGNWVNLGAFHINAGDYGRAREALQRALEIDPENGEALAVLAGVSLLQGRPAEALAAFEATPHELGRLVGVAMAQHSLGNDAASRRALDELRSKYGARKPSLVGVVHAWRRELDLAFEWFDRALAEHDPGLVEMCGGPIRLTLRDDPRYAALLRKMKLPPR
jgi:TolB-like protein/tetratricopeptide (TPR) repeat protein